MTKRAFSSDNLHDLNEINKRIYSINSNEQNVNSNKYNKTELQQTKKNITDYHDIHYISNENSIEIINTNVFNTPYSIFSHLDRSMIARCLFEIYRNPPIDTWEESCIISGIMNRFEIPFEFKSDFRYLLIDIYYNYCYISKFNTSTKILL